MDFARLRTLRELALRKTMAEVAETLHISASAVSQQLALLEEEAGVQLLERRGRRVRLTPAGERLVTHAERVIAVIEEAKTDLAEIRAVVAGELRVSAFSSIASVLVPKAMSLLERLHPHLTVTLDELEPTESLMALRSWETDVALIDDLTVADPSLGQNIETIPVIKDVLYALLPKDHHLAGKRAVTLGDLRNEKWAVDAASGGYGHVIVNACKAAGFEPRINGRCKGFETVLSLIRAGCSVTVLPGMRFVHFKEQICVKHLTPQIDREISLAFRHGESRHPATAAFIKCFKEVCEEYTAMSENDS